MREVITGYRWNCTMDYTYPVYTRMSERAYRKWKRTHPQTPDRSLWAQLWQWLSGC